MHEVKSPGGSCRYGLRRHIGHLHAPKKPLGLRASSSGYFCALAADNERSNTWIGSYSFILLSLKEVLGFSLCRPRLHLR